MKPVILSAGSLESIVSESMHRRISGTGFVDRWKLSGIKSERSTALGQICLGIANVFQGVFVENGTEASGRSESRINQAEG